MAATLSQIKEILLSNAHVAEFLYLLANHKPVCRFIVDRPALQAYLGLAKEYDLAIEIGARMDIIPDASSPYSNKGVRGKGDAQIIYLSKHRELVHKARYFEEQQHHQEFGEILGYPECCCAFFARTQPPASMDYLPAVINASSHDNRNSAPYDYRINIALRYDDFSVLSHFPCNLNCNASLGLAQQYLEILHKQRPDYTKILLKFLTGTILFMPGHGSIYLAQAQQSEDIVTFTKVSGTCSQTLSQIAAKGRILITSKDTIMGLEGKPVEASVLQFGRGQHP